MWNSVGASWWDLCWKLFTTERASSDSAAAPEIWRWAVWKREVLGRLEWMCRISPETPGAYKTANWTNLKAAWRHDLLDVDVISDQDEAGWAQASLWVSKQVFRKFRRVRRSIWLDYECLYLSVGVQMLKKIISGPTSEQSEIFWRGELVDLLTLSKLLFHNRRLVLTLRLGIFKRTLSTQSQVCLIFIWRDQQCFEGFTHCRAIGNKWKQIACFLKLVLVALAITKESFSVVLRPLPSEGKGDSCSKPDLISSLWALFFPFFFFIKH